MKIVEYEDTRIKDIYSHIEKEWGDCYFPGQHKGECLKEYVVVKDAGTNQFNNFSSTITYYDLMVYVPRDNYGAIRPAVERLKKVMKGLWPMIKPTYTETEPFYDEDIKGWMISIQYSNYRKISNF